MTRCHLPGVRESNPVQSLLQLTRRFRGLRVSQQLHCMKMLIVSGLYHSCIVFTIIRSQLNNTWEQCASVSGQRDTSAQWSYKLVPHHRVIADRCPATAARENGKRKNFSRVKARIRWDKEIEIPAWIPLRGGNYKSECQNVSLRSFVFSSAKLCLKSFPRSSFTCRM